MHSGALEYELFFIDSHQPWIVDMVAQRFLFWAYELSDSLLSCNSLLWDSNFIFALQEAIRRATVARKFIPVFMGSAIKNKVRSFILRNIWWYAFFVLTLISFLCSLKLLRWISWLVGWSQWETKWTMS